MRESLSSAGRARITSFVKISGAERQEGSLCQRSLCVLLHAMSLEGDRMRTCLKQTKTHSPFPLKSSAVPLTTTNLRDHDEPGVNASLQRGTVRQELSLRRLI